MEARGCRPSVFIVLECLETLMKNDARVYLKLLLNRAALGARGSIFLSRGASG